MYLKRQNLSIFHWVKFLIKNYKKETKKGVLKRLKNIEAKSERQLKAKKKNPENIKEVPDFVEES